ncbi:MAG: DUF2093 domain-containing protein [Pseudomonadota bacterium]
MLMSASDRPAVLHFEPNGFRVVSPGYHVLCAVTGEPIPLETLRYWSVVRQEAYATPEVATKRLLGED